MLPKVDPICVDSLKKWLQEDPSGPGVPPIAILCKNIGTKEAFKSQLKEIYRYEVLGGLHGVKARQSLLAEKLFSTELSTVHAHVRLSDEDALRLATRHIKNGHYNH